jgi:hypothetical protein
VAASHSPIPESAGPGHPNLRLETGVTPPGGDVVDCKEIYPAKR